MTIADLKNEFNTFDSIETVRSWTKDPQMLHYENEYIKCVRIDSSNHHIPNNKMAKMWSIIFEKKRDFSSLPKYNELAKNINVKITPVNKGNLRGCWGLRIYNVHREPECEVIKMILDFIFS